MSLTEATIRFEQRGSEATAVEIERNSRFPAIVPLYKILFGLGLVIASYQARPNGSLLAERLVLQRRDGGAIDAGLTAKMKAAILPVVLEEGAA